MWKKSGTKFSEYFAVERISWKIVVITIGFFVLVQILETMLGFTRSIVATWPGFSVPENYPAIFKPGFEPEIPLHEFMGIEIKGNYNALLLWAAWLVVNIGGEELLWRGYALPRMEKHFGKWAWAINGVLWNPSIHFFMRWSFITLMPISLLLPYLCQKYKSWVPGLIIHGLGNLLIYILLIPSVLQ